MSIPKLTKVYFFETFFNIILTLVVFNANINIIGGDFIFGLRLKEARKNKGYTLDELAISYNNKFNGKLSKGTLSKYENNRQEPMMHVVNNLSNLLNVSLLYLMGYNVPMEKEKVQSQQCENYEECQKKDIKPLISKILQLDERDKGKISERVDMLLESDKYNYQKELKHA